MNNLETQMLVNEVKGLLDGLTRCAKDAKYQLASDNIHKLNQETAQMRMIINRIDDKIKECQPVSDDDII